MRYTASLGQRVLHRFLHRVAVIVTVVLAASVALAQSNPEAPPEMTWAQDLKDRALLTEFGHLLEKMQRDVQFPPARSDSRLLPLLPTSTTVYAAFSNYGNTSHQILKIFQQEVRENAVLRTWWERGEMKADGPKVEDGLERFYQLSQYLGDEIVMSATLNGSKEPDLLMIAEVRKPDLKEFLQRSARELAGKTKPAMRVLDVRDLATAKGAGSSEETVILVRPDFAVLALNVSALRRFNAELDRKSHAFAGTLFEQRLAQSYEGGATAVAGADLQRIVHEIPKSSNESEAIFQRTGFADTKYLILEHKNVAGQPVSQMEWSFTGPRKGIAAWLAAPGPMGSLDFVSPQALLVGAVSLSDPARIFDEIKDLATISSPNAFASLANMERAMRLSLREDVLSRLGGEVTLEIDRLDRPQEPEWRVILSVRDPEHLQATLATLLAAAPVSPSQLEEGGVTYHALRVPSAQTTLEIGYAFVDGYLVVASSSETLREGIRLHRSGESLGKSRRFLESLPPGRSAEMSAVFYQDPIAMAALRGRQIPELANFFAQAAGQGTPSVMCAYGEERAIREASKSGGADAGVALIVAAVAIPNLLRARISANEASAAVMIRTINVAQISYESAYPAKGFARDLATLGPDPADDSAVSATHASLIDGTLGNASCTAGVWCVRSGFRFTVAAVCRKQKCDDYVAAGTPVNTGTGTRNFCSTSDAIVRSEAGPPLTLPLSAEECSAWPPLQ